MTNSRHFTIRQIDDDEPQMMTIVGTDGDWLVRMSLDDGSVEFGKNYTLDEAARTFWSALGLWRVKH